MSMAVVLGGVVLGVVAVLVVLWTGILRPSGSPPMVKEGLPIIGNLIGFASGPLQFIERNFEKYGPVFSVQVFHKTLTFIIGPKVCEPFFQNLDDVMSQKEVYGFMKYVFGENVVYDAPPAKRKQQMQFMSRGLRADRLKSYVPKIVSETVAFLDEQWGDRGECDLLNTLSELTILTSSRCLHGDDVRETLFKEVSQLYHDLDKGITPVSFFWPTAPLESHKKRDAARVEMVELFRSVIENRRSKSKEFAASTDILQVFVDMTYKDGTQATVDEITGLLIALLFAGQHTSSITSTWTTLFLCANPAIADKCRDEQLRVCGKNKDIRTLTYDDVAKMDLLHNCVKEALRMHPPLIMLMRKAMQPMRLLSQENNDESESDPQAKGKTKKGGQAQSFLVPKGDIAIVSPALAGRLPAVFDDPNVFDPDRYLAPREEHKKFPFAHLGFGGGIHQCMGQQFGYVQVKTILSVILQKYDLELVSPFPEADYTAMVVGPKGHPIVKYTRK